MHHFLLLCCTYDLVPISTVIRQGWWSENGSSEVSQVHSGSHFAGTAAISIPLWAPLLRSVCVATPSTFRTTRFVLSKYSSSSIAEDSTLVGYHEPQKLQSETIKSCSCKSLYNFVVFSCGERFIFATHNIPLGGGLRGVAARCACAAGRT